MTPLHPNPFHCLYSSTVVYGQPTTTVTDSPQGAIPMKRAPSTFPLQGMPRPSWFLAPWALFGDSRKKCVWIWAPLGAQVSKPTQSGSGKRDGGPWGK